LDSRKYWEAFATTIYHSLIKMRMPLFATFRADRNS
jgi:hypothetical protein